MALHSYACVRWERTCSIKMDLLQNSSLTGHCDWIYSPNVILSYIGSLFSPQLPNTWLTYHRYIIWYCCVLLSTGVLVKNLLGQKWSLISFLQWKHLQYLHPHSIWSSRDKCHRTQISQWTSSCILSKCALRLSKVYQIFRVMCWLRRRERGKRNTLRRAKNKISLLEIL